MKIIGKMSLDWFTLYGVVYTRGFKVEGGPPKGDLNSFRGDSVNGREKI